MDELAFEEMLRREFLQEADEILQNFEMSLLKLEAAAEREPLLNEMFRYAHSLKGSGLAAGFDEFGSFAHKVENLLEHMRAGSVLPSKQVIDALLTGVDTLKAFALLLKADAKAVFDCAVQEQQILACWQDSSAKPVSADGPVKEVVKKQVVNKVQGINKKQGVGKVKAVQEAPVVNATMLSADVRPIIYVCEDEGNIREDVVSLFPQGWTVEGFETAQQLIDKVRSQEPHLIISDLRLPGMDGNKMVSILRDEKFDMPVIFISGYADREHLVQFVKLHAFDFFEKPFDHDELLISSKKAIRHWFQEKTLAEISVLAFRNYMKFNTINEILDVSTIEPTKIKKVREMETVMIRIGNLCLQAGKFGQS